MTTLGLAIRSLWNRRATALLTVTAIAISTALLLGVQLLRDATREGFFNTLSGTDLVVGARSGPVNLLLYSVFRIGDATTNVSWASYRKIAQHPDVAWTIPLSLGDSHRGFRVLGTDDSYFEHYRFADDQPLHFASGGRFDGRYDAVLGADVARLLDYELGDSIVIAHGLGRVSFANHEDRPFRITGILARTGTPVDRTVHVRLEGVSALHSGAHEEAHVNSEPPAGQMRAQVDPPSITAFLVGMRSRVMAFTMQRAINEYRAEPMLAILPGVALTQLWELIGVADQALTVVAAFVVLAGLLGMLTMLLTSLGERRREMAVLRSVGATPRHVLSLMLFEAGLLSAAGAAAGIAVTYLLLFAGRPLLQDRFGIFIAVKALTLLQLALLAAIVLFGVLVGLVPALRAYRTTLNDGLQIRL